MRATTDLIYTDCGEALEFNNMNDEKHFKVSPSIPLHNPKFACNCRRLKTYPHNIMFRPCLVALSALIGHVTSQSGVELDAPMLRGGRPNGPGAMLRFGCSQVVVERLDP
jgi:hypothetical protein